MGTNPAIHRRPSGDIDIALPADEQDAPTGASGTADQPSSATPGDQQDAAGTR
jgi:hypothetical protein